MIRLTDDASMDRLRSIYSGAKWKTYWHTLPAHLSDKSIDLYRDDTRLQHFSYTGTLWEIEAYDKVRTAELSEDDRRWIESLFTMNSEATQ
ncbi:MAG: hypothetical protein ACR2NZ_24650 [Rubripirellula sp.]